MPGARIVHELNVAGQGTNRIDVAAIETQAIVGVEIKSRKDMLKRLAEQWDTFSKCCHCIIVAAHEKHFIEHREPDWRDDVPSEIRLDVDRFTNRARDDLTLDQLRTLDRAAFAQAGLAA